MPDPTLLEADTVGDPVAGARWVLAQYARREVHTCWPTCPCVIAREVVRLHELMGDMLRNYECVRPEWHKDWACVECRPDSDMLVEGFRCAYHRARALTGSKP